MRWRRWPAVVVALALVAAGCGLSAAGGGDRPAGPGSTAEVEATAADGAVLDGRQVLAALRGSVALVETPFGTGSSVLVTGGYLVTNAHVVDPFDRVDVTFEGEDPLPDVEVVGVDLATDIALLGPVDVARDRQPIVAADGIDQGSDLYLVGFPGDQDDPQATIARGVLSRRRVVPEWGIELLQSDTTIGAGQSGGALVDEQGRVVGISGLEDRDGFALSLSGDDVNASIERIRDDGGSTWWPVPREGQHTTATVRAQGTLGVDELYLPVADEDRRLVVTVDDAAAAVGLADPGGWLIQANDALVDLIAPGHTRFVDDEWVEPLAADPDGTWTLELPAGLDHVLVVGVDRTGAPLEVVTSEPFARLDHRPVVRGLELGEPAEGSLGYLNGADRYLLHLEEGETVDLAARSPVGDVGFAVLGPSVTYADVDDVVDVDDGGGGLFDLDAVGTYTATEAGLHVIDVYVADGAPTDYRLLVEAG